jgi:uncharacterized membrane protein HdeD (DUF308 family)
MPDQLKSKLADVSKSVLPWQKGIAWWVVLLESVFLIGAGLFMFFAPSKTYNLLGWIVALILLISGGLSLYASYQQEAKSRQKSWIMIHGLIGLVTGLIVIIMLLVNVLLSDAGLVILSLGCLAYGGVGLYISVTGLPSQNRLISLISTIFYLVVGVLVLLQIFGLGAFVTTIQLISFVILAAGIVLLFWAFILRNAGTK